MNIKIDAVGLFVNDMKTMVTFYRDVDNEFERLVTLGATPVLEPTDEPWGQCTSYIADLEGNLLEISSFGG